MTRAQLFGITLLAIAAFAGFELYTKGVDGAFDGTLVSSEPVTRSRRAAGAFQRAWDSTGNRTERALERSEN